MLMMSMSERLSVLTQNEGWFGRAPREFQLLRITGLKPPRHARPERTEVPVTQDELATMLKLLRTTLVQVLRRLEGRGLVDQGYRTLRVLDVPGLTAVQSGR